MTGYEIYLRNKSERDKSGDSKTDYSDLPEAYRPKQVQTTSAGRLARRFGKEALEMAELPLRLATLGNVRPSHLIDDQKPADERWSKMAETGAGWAGATVGSVPTGMLLKKMITKAFPRLLGAVNPAAGAAATAAVAGAEVAAPFLHKAWNYAKSVPGKATRFLTEGLGASLGEKAVAGNLRPLAVAAAESVPMGMGSEFLKEKGWMPFDVMADVVPGVLWGVGKNPRETAHMVKDTLQNAVSKYGKFERSVLRGLKDHLGEGKLAEYKARHDRFENPYEGYEATAAERSMPNEGEELLTGMAQIERALEGSTSAVADQKARNMGVTLAELRKRKLHSGKDGERGTEYDVSDWHDPLKEEWQGDLKGVADEVDRLSPSYNRTPEDVGTGMYDQVEKDLSHFYGARGKASKEAYGVIDNIADPVPTQEYYDYLTEMLKKAIRPSDEGIFRDQLRQLPTPIRDRIFKKGNTEIETAWSKASPEARERVGSLLGVDVPPPSQRDYYMAKLGKEGVDTRMLQNATDESVESMAKGLGIPPMAGHPLYGEGWGDFQRIIRQRNGLPETGHGSDWFRDTFSGLEKKDQNAVLEAIGIKPNTIPASKMESLRKDYIKFLPDAVATNSEKARFMNKSIDFLTEHMAKYVPDAETARKIYKAHSGPINFLNENKFLSKMSRRGFYEGNPRETYGWMADKATVGRDSPEHMSDFLHFIRDKAAAQKSMGEYGRQAALDSSVLHGDKPVVDLRRLGVWDKRAGGLHRADHSLRGDIDSLRQAQTTLESKAGRSDKGRRDKFAEAEQPHVTDRLMNDTRRVETTEDILKRLQKMKGEEFYRAKAGLQNSIFQDLIDKSLSRAKGNEKLLSSNLNQYLKTNKEFLHKFLEPDQIEAITKAAATLNNAAKAEVAGATVGSHTHHLGAIEGKLFGTNDRGIVSKLLHGAARKTKVGDAVLGAFNKNVGRTEEAIKRDFISKLLTDKESMSRALLDAQKVAPKHDVLREIARTTSPHHFNYAISSYLR